MITSLSEQPLGEKNALALLAGIANCLNGFAPKDLQEAKALLATLA